jgi:hypothetical protein
MPDRDDMDKRLEEELGEILDKRASRLPAPRARDRRSSSLSPTRSWRSHLWNVALAGGILALTFLLIRIGPFVALRFLPFLIFLGIAIYAVSRLRRSPLK